MKPVLLEDTGHWLLEGLTLEEKVGGWGSLFSVSSGLLCGTRLFVTLFGSSLISTQTINNPVTRVLLFTLEKKIYIEWMNDAFYSPYIELYVGFSSGSDQWAIVKGFTINPRNKLDITSIMYVAYIMYVSIINLSQWLLFVWWW